MAKDTLPAPEDNVKPSDYKELFEVREAKPRKPVEWFGCSNRFTRGELLLPSSSSELALVLRHVQLK